MYLQKTRLSKLAPSLQRDVTYQQATMVSQYMVHMATLLLKDVYYMISLFMINCFLLAPVNVKIAGIVPS